MPALYPLPTATADGDQAVAVRRQVAELARQTEVWPRPPASSPLRSPSLSRGQSSARKPSVDATAESLSLSRSAVYHLLSTGQLVSAKVGTRRLIPLSAIDAFLATATSDEQAS